METFNANNTKCPWDLTSFQLNEEGMKCTNRNCGAVMKLDSWQEKKYCRTCNGDQAVRVRAAASGNETSTRRIGSALNNPSRVRFTSRTTVNTQENTGFNNPSRTYSIPQIQRQQAPLSLITKLVFLLGISFISPATYYTALNSSTYLNETLQKIWSISVYDNLNSMMDNLWKWNPQKH